MPPSTKRLRSSTKLEAIDYKVDEDDYIVLTSSSEDESDNNDENEDDTENETEIYKCERIVKMRYNYKEARKEFLLKWLGYASKFNTWEPRENILCKSLIKDFKKRIRESNNNIRPTDTLHLNEEVFDNEDEPIQLEVNPIIEYSSIEPSVSKTSRSKPLDREFKDYSSFKTNHANEKKIKKKLFCCLNKIKPKIMRPILKPNGMCIEKVEPDRDSSFYHNGLEPKIINQHIDQMTGKLIYHLKWKPSVKIDTMSSDLVKIKFPQIIERFKNIVNSKNNSADTE